MVTAVKNQKSCGSCWAFSTVGAMEALWNIKLKGINETFSEQQLVDCAHDFDCHGCFGGLPSRALQYVKQNPLMYDKDYEYHAAKGHCKYNYSKGVAYAKGASYNIT